MNEDRKEILLTRGKISELSVAEEEACLELVEHIERSVKVAGEPVGSLALFLAAAKARYK